VKPVHRLTAAFAALLFAAPVVRAQTFQGLGFLESGEAHAWSEASDVSNDGSTVVGWALKNHPTRGPSMHGFRWVRGQMTVLPPAYAQYAYGSYAAGVNADGTVAVGWSTGAYVGQQRAATRWTGTAGSDIGPQVYAQGAATSADGTVVVGQSSTQTLRSVSGASPRHIIIGGQSSAYDVSADGAVMVGYAYSPGTRAYRWENETVEFLPPLPGGDEYNHAYGISSDGTIIVGWSRRDGQFRMVRWVNRVIEDLGAIGIAKSTSANGQVIVGDNDATSNLRRAMIWTPARGAEDLQTFLVDQLGLDLTGWTLISAASVSADGGTIVGHGRNPSGKLEAWRATFRGNNDIVVNVDGDETDANNTDSVCDVDTSDPGPQCTLRAAFQVALAKPGSRITFDIPGSGVPRIALQSALPAMTARVEIDATTQAGGFVEVRGGADFDGLRLSGGNSAVKGLVLNNFTRTGATGGGAIVLSGAGNNTITGNRIGTDAAGNTAIANRSGIVIDGSPNNTIGGSGDDANLISGNEYGIQMRGAGGNRIRGNRIGLAVNGGIVRNIVGVLVAENSNNTTIGGEFPNRIVSRDYDLIVGSDIGPSAGVEIRGNYFGLNEAGTNAGDPTDIYTGIAAIAVSTNTAVSGLQIIDNHLAGHLLGIWVAGMGVSEARIAGNWLGFAFNNSGALPAGRNATASSATGIRTEASPKTTVENNIVAGVTIGVMAAGSLQIEASTDANGEQRYRLYGPTFPLTSDPGPGNEVRIVGNTVGLNASNAKPSGADQKYGISVFGGADKINIENNTVAGFTEADVWASESSNVVVSGNRIGTADGTNHGSVLGVWIEDVNTATIGGVGIEARNIISRHTDAGILIEGESSNVLVLNNHIGTDITSTTAWPNGVGIRVLADSGGIPGLSIRENIIGGNTGMGLDIDNSVSTQIMSNRIGVSTNGLAIANGTGIRLGTSPAVVSGNFIAHNDGAGLDIDAADVTITGNSIYENDAGIVYATAPFSAPAGVLVMRTDPRDSDKIGVFVAVAPTGAPAEVTLEIFGNRTCENPQGRVLLLKRSLPGNKALVEFFATESWNSFGTLNGFTVTATRGTATSTFSACSEAKPFTDSDDDGAMDLFEFVGGDRNDDRIPDIDQRNVATHLSLAVGGSPQLVTLVSAPGTTLQQSAVITGNLPPIEGVTYTVGLAMFDIQGLPAGTQTTLDMILESGRPTDDLRYLKIRTVNDTQPLFLPDTGTGDRAERTSTGWRLYLTDGGQYDIDGTVNGRIRDPGGPVKYSMTPPTQNPPAAQSGKRGGGGSMDFALCLLLSALVLGRLIRRRAGRNGILGA
jgi:uncharacterized membrane protein